MSRALDTLARYLQEHDWPAKRVPDRLAFKARKEGELCPVVYYFQLEPELDQFLFYIAPELSLFQEMLPPMAELVCRANDGLRIGSFELSFRTGQLSFRSSLNFRGLELTAALIDNVIQPALAAYDEFFPAVARVIAGLDTPAEAIRKVEYPDDEDPTSRR